MYPPDILLYNNISGGYLNRGDNILYDTGRGSINSLSPEIALY